MIEYELREVLDPRGYFTTLEGLESWGSSIAMNGDGTVLVVSVWGTPDTEDIESGVPKGGVYTYDYNPEGAVWVQRGPVLVSPYVEQEGAINFGGSVDISADGTLLAIAEARVRPTTAYICVTGYLYSRADDEWVLIQEIPTWEDARQVQSTSYDCAIALSGDGSTLCIGVPRADLYDYSGTEGCILTYSVGSATPTHIWFGGSYGSTENYLGTSLALSGDGSVLAVGHPTFESTNYVEIYDRDGVGWTKRMEVSGTELFDQPGMKFGSDVSLSYIGDRLLVGGRYYTSEDEIIESEGSRYTSSYTPTAEPFPESLEGDPQWNEVLSLFHCDDGDVSGGFLLDYSSYEYSAVVEGTLDTADLGGAYGHALWFPSYTAYAEIAYSLPEAIGNNSWCFETRFYAPSALSGDVYLLYFDAGNSVMVINDSGTMRLWVSFGGTGGYIYSSFEPETWYGIAIDYNKSAVHSFVDGDLVGTISFPTGLTISSTGWELYGWSSSGSGVFYQDEIRFTLGNSELIREGFGNEGRLFLFSLVGDHAHLLGQAKTSLPQELGLFGSSVALATQAINLFAGSSLYNFSGACVGDGAIEVYTLSPPVADCLHTITSDNLELDAVGPTGPDCEDVFPCPYL